MNYITRKRKSGLNWKVRLLVYVATILFCVLAANFRAEIQRFTGISHPMNQEIITLEE